MAALSSYAKIDPAHFLDGLFIPRRREGQALVKVEGRWDKGYLRFTGPQLSAEDQSVLLAVAARTGRDGLLIDGSQKDLRAQQLELLEADGAAEEADVSQVNATAYSLLVDAGLPPEGRQYARMIGSEEHEGSLQRLGAVSIYRKVDGRGGNSHLLRFGHDDDTGKLWVTLNWRLTQAIFAITDTNYVRVSLHERRELDSSVAQVLHAWLSAFTRPGRRYGFEQNPPYLESLIPHVWGHRKVADGTRRRRLQALRSALEEIDGLQGWVAQAEGKRVVVSRPKRLPPADKADLTPGQLDEALSDPGVFGG